MYGLHVCNFDSTLASSASTVQLIHTCQTHQLVLRLHGTYVDSVGAVFQSVIRLHGAYVDSVGAVFQSVIRLHGAYVDSTGALLSR